MTALKTSEFVLEAKEHLSEVCDQLLRLEKSTPGNIADRIEPMLRAIHSVKGGAGFFGFRTIEALCHKMEAALERTLATGNPPDDQMVDILLTATDRVAALVDDLEGSNTADVGEILKRLDALSASLDARGSSAVVDVPRESDVPLDPMPLDAIAEAPVDTGRFPLVIDLTACQLRGIPPLEVVERVLRLGQVEIGELQWPQVDLLDSPPIGPVIWRAMVVSSLEASQFHVQLNLPPEADASRVGAEPRVAVSIPPKSPAPTTAPREETRGADASQSIRIPVELADRLVNLAGELVLVRNQSRRFAEANAPLPASVVQRFDAVTSDFQATVLQTRMQPVGNLFQRFPRMVRDLGRQLGKQIELEIRGAEVELDKAIVVAISDPLTHLLRNACDHGLERPEIRAAQGKSPEGKIELSARHAGDQIHILISDNGRGIDREAVAAKALRQGLRTAEELARMDDRELLGLILLPGFSTAAEVTEVSGRGVGMDVVRTNLAPLGGTIEIESVKGRGTTITLRLPLTLAIIPSLLVEVGGQRFAIPQRDLEELVGIDPRETRARIEWTRGQEMVRLRGRLLPLVRLPNVVDPNMPSGLDAAPPSAHGESSALFAVVKSGGRRFGLVVDRVLASEEIVVKPMHGRLRGLAMYSGATILGDGSVALILSAEGIATVAQVRFTTDAETVVDSAKAQTEEALDVLLVRQLDGQLSCVPVKMIRRIVMLDRERLECIASKWYVVVDGKPLNLFPLGQSGDPSGRVPSAEVSTAGVSSAGRDKCFVLVARDAEHMGCLVKEVLGTRSIQATELQSLPHQARVLGGAVLLEGITPIVDLSPWIRDANSEPRNSTMTANDIHPKRVLLVDDTKFFRDVVGKCLRDEGYEVTTAEQGAEALDLLRAATFDLVVSDLEMPVLDGLGLATAVRHMEPLRHLPLLALTTLSGTEIRDRARRHGFDALEVKFDPSSFVSAVRTLLARERSAAVVEEFGYVG